ncbi:hypothetical protein [Rhodoferax sp.]|uniref:hypothetical protein n=1 Tax=Rhodoferax sp. TaxID=50421 RepID=UPI0025DBF698|nr:hypothetical protein [Rhodoferax sp.]
MRMKSDQTLMGIKASEGEVEGNKYSSTTFYLPADLAANATSKTMGAVTVPYKFGDASEYQKWANFEKNFPATGLPVSVEFDIVAGKDAQGRDSAKVVLVAIAPRSVARPAA